MDRSNVSPANPLGLEGLACVELAAPEGRHHHIARLLRALGFSRRSRHGRADVDVFDQQEIRFLLNHEPGSFASHFARAHGPSIPSIGLFVADAEHARREAERRGARPAPSSDVLGGAPAIEGVGGSRMYFVERAHAFRDFVAAEKPDVVRGRGLVAIDHLTNNVEKGTLETWRTFYREVFGFTDVRSFEIEGKSTGLTSYALRSPCGTFSIPINEGREDRSQIEEYLREYHGAGIQHIALASLDLLSSLEGLDVPTLDIERDYYETVFDRVPNVREDHDEIMRRQVLVDGDEHGYLLQIFTRNVIGPIFFELIQRRNHHSFGEGNFGALFRSIERDQERRGVV
jgi:4-hydroxyphenylpyruvate dioxygenase